MSCYITKSTDRPVYVFLVLVTLLCLLQVFSTSAMAEQLLRFEGRALDQKSQALLYVEKHAVTMNDDGRYLTAQVEYIDPNGQVFASKMVDYSQSQFTPDFSFNDLRSDQRINVSLVDQLSSEPMLRIMMQSKGEQQESRVEVEDSATIVDAGFDRFIFENWAALRSAKKMDFSFLAITRAQLINFEVVEKDTEAGRVILELHPRNFFISLLVKPITLEYDKLTKRLMSFKGLSNIEQYKDGRPTNKNYLADIYYQYQDIQYLGLSKREP